MTSNVLAGLAERRGARIAGWILGAVPCSAMLFTAALKIAHFELAVHNFVEEFGLTAEMLRPLGVLQIVCTVLHLVPRTAIVGAILITGYLGGATVTELRAAASPAFPIAMGVLVWLGLALRDRRFAAALFGARESVRA